MFMPVILALGKGMQEHKEFKATLYFSLSQRGKKMPVNRIKTKIYWPGSPYLPSSELLKIPDIFLIPILAF